MSYVTRDRIEYASAKQQAEALANKQISSIELLQKVIKRIETLDKKLNAIVVFDLDNALDAAKRADEALKRGERKPLLGVPITVKESFNVKGLPTTLGNPENKNNISKEDAYAIKKLREAGAIILGKSNVPLNLADWQSYNEIYGTTKNVWNITRTPGGSSGGGAVAVAAGYVSLELGSDIGGSLRIPAHYTGIYAHKPTYDLLPSAGHGLPSDHLTGNGLSVIGPLARDAGDLEIALDILAAPSAHLAKGYQLNLPKARHEKLSDFRVLVLDSHPVIASSHEVKGAIQQFAKALENADVKVAYQSDLLPDLIEEHQVYIKLLRTAKLDIQPEAFLEHAKKVAAKFETDDQSFKAQNARAALIRHKEWMIQREKQALFLAQWETLFKTFDIVVTPVAPVTAFPLDESEPREERTVNIDGRHQPYWDFNFWVGLATLPGLPATSLPIGIASDGLPVGVQAIGGYLEDRTTIQFAKLVAELRGGFVSPPGY